MVEEKKLKLVVIKGEAQKWGNSIAVRIPAPLCKAKGIIEGSDVILNNIEVAEKTDLEKVVEEYNERTEKN